MHITMNKVNGIAVDGCSDIVNMAINFWYKAGYHGSDAICGTKEVPNCKKYVERYLNKDIEKLGNEMGEKKQITDYKGRLKSKNQRQSVLRDVFKGLDGTLKARGGGDAAEEKKGEDDDDDDDMNDDNYNDELDDDYY